MRSAMLAVLRQASDEERLTLRYVKGGRSFSEFSSGCDGTVYDQGMGMTRVNDLTREVFGAANNLAAIWQAAAPQERPAVVSNLLPRVMGAAETLTEYIVPRKIRLYIDNLVSTGIEAVLIVTDFPQIPWELLVVRYDRQPLLLAQRVFVAVEVACSSEDALVAPSPYPDDPPSRHGLLVSSRDLIDDGGVLTAPSAGGAGAHPLNLLCPHTFEELSTQVPDYGLVSVLGHETVDGVDLGRFTLTPGMFKLLRFAPDSIVLFLICSVGLNVGAGGPKEPAGGPTPLDVALRVPCTTLAPIIDLPRGAAVAVALGLAQVLHKGVPLFSAWSRINNESTGPFPSFFRCFGNWKVSTQQEAIPR